jgi:hypothetical protein
MTERNRKAAAKAYAARMKELTADQLFRIANYVPDNEEMYDDRGIELIYMQIRAAADELHRRRAKKNPSDDGMERWIRYGVTPQSSLPKSQRDPEPKRPGRKLHHYYEERVPQRAKRMGIEAAERSEAAERGLNKTLSPPALDVADLGAMPDGVYAFQTSGVPGFAGDYVIAAVEGGKAFPVTFFATEEHLYRREDGSDVIDQTHEDQMVPRWDTLTIPYNAYMPRQGADGKYKAPRRASAPRPNATKPSALHSDDRQVVVDKIVLRIMHKYVPRGVYVPWQDILLFSQIDGTPQIPPLTPGEVAESVRRLGPGGTDRGFSGTLQYKWRVLPFAPEDFPVEKCYTKYCEPLFTLTYNPGEIEAARYSHGVPRAEPPKPDESTVKSK